MRFLASDCFGLKQATLAAARLEFLKTKNRLSPTVGSEIAQNKESGREAL